MLASFGDKATEDIYHGRGTKTARAIPRELWERIRIKLDLLNASTTMADIRVPPSNRLEKLRGSMAGLYSIRVNDQYRIVFRFRNGGCEEVRCTDYH
jgi:proteic killer suppression protein